MVSMSRSGNKAAVIERVNDDTKVVLVDTDSGIHFELKKRRLAVVRGTSSGQQLSKLQ